MIYLLNFNILVFRPFKQRCKIDISFHLKNSYCMSKAMARQSNSDLIIVFRSGYLQKGNHSTERMYSSATFHKGYKKFTGVRVHGESAVLKGPGSVQLHIPEGLFGFIFGHAHTDPTPFLNHIPATECLVSPIVEYNRSFTYCCPMGLFKIKLPHCVKNKKHFLHIRVRHGDIYQKTPFYEKCTFTVDREFIIIQTSSFSQFICTVAGCQESCYGNPKAFIFGHITPLRYLTIYSAVRIYMCSPLYDITDFKQVYLSLCNLLCSINDLPY